MKEFINKVAERLNSEKVYNGFEGFNFEYEEITKNNGVKFDTLKIQYMDGISNVNLYLYHLYRRYKFLGLEEIYCEVLKLVDSAIEDWNRQEELRKCLEDKEFVKDNMQIAVINKYSNDLRGLQYVDVEGTDLVAILKVVNGNYAKSIKKRVLDEFGWEFNECFEKAKEKLNSHICKMSEIISELEGEDIDSEYIGEVDNIFLKVSNKKQFFGANAILDKKVLRKIAELFQDDFYIIPSSVHEIMVLSRKRASNRFGQDLVTDCIAEILRNINDKDVDDIDILSYHLFYYSKETESISIVA